MCFISSFGVDRSAQLISSQLTQLMTVFKNVWVTCGTADHLYLLTSVEGQRHMVIIYVELSNCYFMNIPIFMCRFNVT